MVWGGYGLATELGGDALVRYARFAVGGVAVHDLLLAPLVVVVGVLLARLVPERVRDLVQGGLVVSGTLAALAAPFVLGYGRRADDPSALPLDYGRGLLVTLAAVWAGVLVLGVFDSDRSGAHLLPAAPLRPAAPGGAR